MKNEIPKKPALLIQSAEEAAYGASLYPALLLHNNEASIRADRTTAFDADAALKVGRKGLRDQRLLVNNLMISGRDFLTVGRDVLKPRLGKKHSEAWKVLGFATSLAIPEKLEGVTALLEGYAEHFEDHPEHEDANLNLTANRARALLAGIVNGNNLVNDKKSEVKTLTIARDAAISVLRQRLIDVKAELGIKLGSMDERWLKFGFNLPGLLETPDIPLNVIAVLIGLNAVAVKWDKAARAGHYRVWKKVVGVDEDFINVGSPSDLDFALQDLPANASIQIVVSAVNDSGESAKSEVVTVQTA